ncbi:hypothetical protein ACCO45_011029 [Purpureocillium lilacinum]|uniref:Uncharacterized protein n=1 Tax=Purpureocillium lilacinum TaxID=33203 RepID=A0ACC4DJ57_PURLI
MTGTQTQPARFHHSLPKIHYRRVVLREPIVPTAVLRHNTPECPHSTDSRGERLPSPIRVESSLTTLSPQSHLSTPTHTFV